MYDADAEDAILDNIIRVEDFSATFAQTSDTYTRVPLPNVRR